MIIKKLFPLISLFLLISYNANALKLSSDSIKNHQFIAEKYVFDGFGCAGQNISPQLSWSDIPDGTKSFALTVYDPDAPTGSGWWHWVVFNIPTSITNIKEGIKTSEWAGVIESLNDYGTKKFGGPCPPKGHGKHRYIFKIYALSVDKLPLDSDTNPAKVGFYIHSNKIAEAQIKAYYQR